MKTARALVPLLLLVLALPARAEVDEKTFGDAKKTANRYMKVAGEGGKKEKAIAVLARDDSLRAAQVLVKWVRSSQSLRERELVPAYVEAQEKLDQVVAQLQKGYTERFTDSNKNGRYDKGEPFKDLNKNGKRDGWPPRTMNAKHKKAWETLKKQKAAAQNRLAVEDMVLTSIGMAFENYTNVPALRWLAHEGVDALDKAKEPGPVRLGVVGGLIRLNGKWCIDRLLQLGGPDADVKARLRIINWAGMAKSKEAWDLVAEALEDKHVVVQRQAVAALKAYDDPRCVKPLIDALGKAEGLLAQEIDKVLYYYVGHAFDGAVKIWRKWWKHEGEAWLAKKPTERHEPREVTQSHTTTASTFTTFYDIKTESKRIVFVLDRSGSMKEKARHKHTPKEKPKKPKKGPVVTGDKRKSKKDKSEKDEEEEDGPLEGTNKLEVAKSKLAQTIERMAKDVHFNVVFYSTDVSTWKKAPSMHVASKGNKNDAIKWFSGQEPQGSTSLFAALMKALEYADAFGGPGDKKKRKKGSHGANTIFLLSDGSPTEPGGSQGLSPAKIDKKLKKFLKKNELYKVVVHTIGVGRGHNRSLMRRIANATGGEYRAVGVD